MNQRLTEAVARVVGKLMLILCLLLPALASAQQTELASEAARSAEPVVLEAPADSLDVYVKALHSTNFNKKVEAVEQLGTQQDERVLPILQAMLQNRLFFNAATERTYFQDGAKLVDAISGEVATEESRTGLSRISVNNRLRNVLTGLIAAQQLLSPDEEKRYRSARALLDKPTPDNLKVLETAISVEKSDRVKEVMELAHSLILVQSREATVRLKAVEDLSGSLYPQVRAALNQILMIRPDGSFVEPNAEVRAAAQAALEKIETRLQMNRIAENTYFGLALGAVLLLAAIGLAITFGVMGVINMAHGEMIMLGAYTTFVIQQLMPNHIDYSLFVAVPVAFLVTGAVGILIERGVIRFLYGRPLETLLATFGISLILQQAVRTIFSPLNQSVASPSWMSGSFEVNSALSLTYNRLYIILFALAVLAALILLLKKSFFGLQMRAVTQNRPMASSMGIRTGWVDALTFGLGSGIAGIAGVALSQLTNVGPNLGQAYIIDSFMVVVFGGVGNLMGTFVAAMSLGIINKIIEPFSGAVLAKILVLVFIILFIQKRPRGLFALKGRFVEG